MSDICLVYVTAASREEAQRIAEAVVSESLAACANIFGSIESVYHWQGKLEHGAEVALLLKTQQPIIEALIFRIRQLHSYECPAILVVPVLGGNEGFLAWIRSETSLAVK
jgi:periplasmic divalent cation tolerance protein